MHELAQDAVVDEHVAAGGETFAVDVGGGVRLRVGRVVDQGHPRGRHRLAESVTEQGPALDDRLAVECRGDHTDELRGHVRIEHDRQTAARRLCRPEQTRRPVDRFTRRPVEIELVGRATHGEPEPVWVSASSPSPSSASVETDT